jgi:hypothetical protein
LDIQGVDQTTRKLAPQPAPPKPRFSSLRAWLRSRTGRIVTLSVVLLVGIFVGIAATLLFALSIGGTRPALSTPSAQGGDIIIQGGIVYTTHLVNNGLRSSGIVNASNVQVTMAQGDLMTIDGDDELIFGLTRHFTIVVQPIIRNCQLQMRVLSASLAGIPVTQFVATFENRINQQLQSKPSALPSGFIYCETSVRTDPRAGIFITVSATPV